MKEIINNSVSRFLNNVIDNIPVKKSGTYNRQDPTHFEKGDSEFTYKGVSYLVSFNNCGWGIDLTISKYSYPDLKWGKIDICEIYLTTERNFIDGKWKNVDIIIPRQKGFKGCLKLLALGFPEILKPGFKSLREQEYERYATCEDDPMGCLADYE